MRTFWDAYALVYDSLRHLLPYQELMKKAVEALNIQEDGLNVLDVGCGTGNFAETLFHLTARDMHVTGIDASETMLRRAAKKARRLSGFSVSRADLNARLPYKDGTFDHIVCLNALYAVKDPEFTLGELRRVLKFGGRLVIANPKRDPRIRDGFIAHFKAVFSLKLLDSFRMLFKTFFLAPVFALVVGLNYLIKKRAEQREHHFLHLEELSNLVERREFVILDTESVYGGTANFAILTKVIRRTGEVGEVLTAEVAQTREDFDAIFRLRYNVYCEEMRSLDPEDYPKQQEIDRYDSCSIHFLLRRNGVIVGTFRLIRDSDYGFLMEELFAIPGTFERFRMLEASRIVIRKDLRGTRLLHLLCDAGRLWSVEHGFTLWCLTPQVGLLSILEDAQWKFIKIGATASYHNRTVVPIIRIL